MFSSLGAALALGLVAAAAGPAPAAENTPAATVGLFKAQRAGQIEVKLIPKDAAEGTVVIINKTQQPLTIKLPAAFAGVPVLGQRGARGGGVNGANAGSALAVETKGSAAALAAVEVWVAAEAELAVAAGSSTWPRNVSPS